MAIIINYEMKQGIEFRMTKTSLSFKKENMTNMEEMTSMSKDDEI